MIYIYFEDLERALKFIFLRKYINQSFRESLWKFTDFLPCGKSYFSKANLCSPNLDKGVPSLAHRPVILRFERNPAVMLYFYTWQNCLCKTCARERSSSIFSTPNFDENGLNTIWKENKERLSSLFSIEKSPSEIVAFYRLHLHYSISSIEI